MASQSDKMGHDRVRSLDLLRLFAALAVVFYHYSFRGAAADNLTWLALPDIAPLTKYGYLGVQLFFVISGFVIAYSAEGRSAREFVIARAARIYPGFLVCMSLTFLIVAAFGAPRLQASFTQWAANLLIVAPAVKQPYMDFGYWSIVCEIVFYAWMTAIIAAGLFRHQVIVVAVWLTVSAANELYLGSSAVRHLLITNHSGFFAAGLMLYALHGGRRAPTAWCALAAATVLAAFQANWNSDWDRAHFGVEFSHVAVAGISVATVGLVGACLLVKRLPIPAGVVLTLGGLTYPLYLIHQMVGFVAFNRLEGVAPPATLVAATVAAMLIVSWIIYRFVERPGQKAMKAILTRLLRVPKNVAVMPAQAISTWARSRGRMRPFPTSTSMP